MNGKENGGEYENNVRHYWPIASIIDRYEDKTDILRGLTSDAYLLASLAPSPSFLSFFPSVAEVRTKEKKNTFCHTSGISHAEDP